MSQTAHPPEHTKHIMTRMWQRVRIHALAPHMNYRKNACAAHAVSLITAAGKASGSAEEDSDATLGERCGTGFSASAMSADSCNECIAVLCERAFSSGWQLTN